MESIKDKLERRTVLNKETGCIEWTGGLFNGYGMFRVKDNNGKWKTQRAHRMAYEEYVGDIPEGLMVCHHCDNTICVNTEHLFLGTHADNMWDMQNKGRHNPTTGESHASAKLTEEKVRLIRQLNSYGVAQKKIAAAYGVTHAAINQVVNRKTWRHIA